MNDGKFDGYRIGKNRQQKPQQQHNGQSISIMSEELANELHKPVRKHFKKRRVISKHVDDIWAADLVDMQYYSSSKKATNIFLWLSISSVNMDGVNH